MADLLEDLLDENLDVINEWRSSRGLSPVSWAPERHPLDPTTRSLLLAGVIETRALPRMSQGNSINALTEWPKPSEPEPDEAEVDEAFVLGRDLFADEDFADLGEDDGFEPMSPRERMLLLVGVELRAAKAAKSNPAPGRQVLTVESSKHFGLPVGATILPGGKVRMPNGVVVTLATAKKHYKAGTLPAVKGAKKAAPAKAVAPKVAKAPAKKAAKYAQKPAGQQKPAYGKGDMPDFASAAEATEAAKQAMADGDTKLGKQLFSVAATKKKQEQKAAGLKVGGALHPPTQGAKFEVLPEDQRGAKGDGYHAGGKWGLYGASGVVIRDTSGPEPRYLLVQRGPMVSHNSGLWQLPGGAKDENESAYQGAARETQEELGASDEFLGNLSPVGEHVFTDDAGWTYTTIAADSDGSFIPQADGTETGDARWVTAAEIARMQQSGRLTSSTAKSLQPIIESMPAPKPAKAAPPVKANAQPATAGDDLMANVPGMTLTQGSNNHLQVEHNGAHVGDVWEAAGGGWTGTGVVATVYLTKDDAIQSLVDFHLHGTKPQDPFAQGAPTPVDVASMATRTPGVKGYGIHPTSGATIRIVGDFDPADGETTFDLETQQPDGSWDTTLSGAPSPFDLTHYINRNPDRLFGNVQWYAPNADGSAPNLPATQTPTLTKSGNVTHVSLAGVAIGSYEATPATGGFKSTDPSGNVEHHWSEQAAVEHLFKVNAQPASPQTSAPAIVLGVEDSTGVTKVYDTSSGSPVEVATLEPHPGGGKMKSVIQNGQQIGHWSDNTSHTLHPGYNTSGANGEHLGLFQSESEAVAAIMGSPGAPSIYVDSGTLPKGAKKVAPTIQAAAPTAETVSEVKVPPAGTFAKTGFDIYVGTTKYGSVEQSYYGGWEAKDPAGGFVGTHTSKAKAVAALVGAKAKAQAKAAQQAQAALTAQQQAAAKQAADAARAAQRAKVDADLARLRGRDPNPTPEVQAVYDGDFSALTRVGAQAGSNEGGVFEAPDGSRWYVKVQKLPEHAASEALAVEFYRAAGIDAPEVHIGAGTPDLSPGTHTATRILETVDSDLGPRVQDAGKGLASATSYIRRAHEGFALDAWLANWDVAGTSNDNIVTLDGKPVRIDSGGSLLYRAQGQPKGDAFGPVVTEWDRWLDPAKASQDSPAGHAAALHSTATPGEILASASRMEEITPDRIRAMVAARGLDPSLAETLILRREDILRRAGDMPTQPVAPVGHGALTGKAAQGALRFDDEHSIADVLRADGVPEIDAKAAQRAVNGYTDKGHTIVNPYLYGYGSPTAEYGGQTAVEIAENMDLVMDHAGLSEDIVVHWGMRDLGRRFPPGTYDLAGSDAVGNSATGLEFDARGFASTSTDVSESEKFAGYSWNSSKKPAAATAQKTVVRTQVPKGSGAIRGEHGEAEIILDRRLRLRIVADHGVDADGFRRLDAVVIGTTQARYLHDLSLSELQALLAANGLSTDGDRNALLERLYAAGIKPQ